MSSEGGCEAAIRILSWQVGQASCLPVTTACSRGRWAWERPERAGGMPAPHHHENCRDRARACQQCGNSIATRCERARFSRQGRAADLTTGPAGPDHACRPGLAAGRGAGGFADPPLALGGAFVADGGLPGRFGAVGLAGTSGSGFRPRVVPWHPWAAGRVRLGIGDLRRGLRTGLGGVARLPG